MNKIRISAIRYANTFPFNYGLKESGIEDYAIIDIDHPAECARKLKNGEADIGLVPVAEIRNIENAKIISNFCIGTNSPVKTVLLVSNHPFNEIDTVYLDFRSRSSVALAKILAKELWHKDYVWKQTFESFNFKNIPENSGLVIIGDQCFEFEDHYTYKIDLATEWKKLESLPFVFACWVSNKDIDQKFLKLFNDALQYGINNIDKAIEKYKEHSLMSAETLKTYLTENIDYLLNDEKRTAMKIFFDYLDGMADGKG